MRHARWYDKNPDLKDVFDFIETLNEEIQAQIAQDILQIMISEFGANFDARINEITQNSNYKFSRWYDKNLDLYTSFEMLKELPKHLQDEMVKKIIDSILFIYTERNLHA